MVDEHPHSAVPVELPEETLALHKKLTEELRSRVDVRKTLRELLEETNSGNFNEECLKGLVRELGVFLRPNNDSLVPVEDATKADSIHVLSQLAQSSHTNRILIEESGILGTSLVDLLNYPDEGIQENMVRLLHFMSRSQQISVRIAKPWALNPLVSLFVTCDKIEIMNHLVACFANLVALDNHQIICTQEVIDRVAYLLKSGPEACREHAAFFVCNSLIRKDATTTHLISKSGLTEIMVELVRAEGVSPRGAKPILASLGMMAEGSVEIQTNAVKLGILAPVSNILCDKSQSSLHELCLELTFTLASVHEMNKMQILTAGFMEPLQFFAKGAREDIKHAQKALRALAALSDSKMFPSIFGLPNLEILADVIRCGDYPMVQCAVVILLNLGLGDAEFRNEIKKQGFVQQVKSYVERLGEAKASNPVFQDFVAEMEKRPVEPAQPHEGWFSSVSNQLWASAGALSAKLVASPTATAVPPQEWTVHEVCEWLKRYWYSQYTEAFSKHLINGALLLDLSDQDLQELGITDKFHRRGILKQIQVLKQR